MKIERKRKEENNWQIFCRGDLEKELKGRSVQKEQHLSSAINHRRLKHYEDFHKKKLLEKSMDELINSYKEEKGTNLCGMLCHLHRPFEPLVTLNGGLSAQRLAVRDSENKTKIEPSGFIGKRKPVWHAWLVPVWYRCTVDRIQNDTHPHPPMMVGVHQWYY